MVVFEGEGGGFRMVWGFLEFVDVCFSRVL